MAAGDLQLRGRDLHRRSRAGRRTRAGPRQGRTDGHQARAHLHRRFARGVRARFRLPDDARQRPLRGGLPARHLDRATAHFQTADRDRPRDRRRRHRAWSDRQGQRPNPFRAFRLCPGSRHQGDRALARMGLDQPHRADRLGREAPDPGAEGQARREPILDRRQPAAHFERRESARGSVGGSAGLRLFAHRQPGGCARRA